MKPEMRFWRLPKQPNSQDNADFVSLFGELNEEELFLKAKEQIALSTLKDTRKSMLLALKNTEAQMTSRNHRSRIEPPKSGDAQECRLDGTKGNSTHLQRKCHGRVRGILSSTSPGGRDHES